MTPESKTPEQQKKWVVMSPTGEALPFKTEAEAEQWLNADAEVCTPDIEAKNRGVLVEIIIAE